MLLRLTSDAVRTMADSIIEAKGFAVAHRAPEGVYEHPFYNVVIDPGAAPIPYLGGDIPLLDIIDAYRAHDDVFDIVVQLFFSQVIVDVH
jgi:hypothetical protein